MRTGSVRVASLAVSLAVSLVVSLVMSDARAQAQVETRALDPDAYRLVDLSHSFNAETIYWPTSPSRFELDELAHGQQPGGYFYSSYALATPEHGGTHLDAPVHFAENGLTSEAIPLRNLIAPGVVIDVASKAAEDRNYRLSAADVLAFEAEHGRIPAGAIVLLRTDWSDRWPNVLDYLGDDTPGDASRLSFPSFGEDAAALLIEQRGVVVLGVDTASIDYGVSDDFPVHRLAGEHNVSGLENLTNLRELPASGFTVIALPMKIEGGSGGPARVVALIGR